MFAAIEFIFATFAWKLFGEKAWHKVYDLINVDQGEDMPTIDGPSFEEEGSEISLGTAPPSISESEKSD